MKKFLKVIGILASLVVLAVIVVTLLTPWMDRWGATDEEIAASFPGDEPVEPVGAGVSSSFEAGADDCRPGGE